MGTEIEHTSSNVQTTATTPSSTTSTSGPKVSMFAKKSGFVIPKNKLAGSLVPKFRGKKGDADQANEESANHLQRKTKWGPDLTMDPTVLKGRALAYQTRINQISQQLTLGTLDLEDNEGSVLTSELQDGKTSDHQLSNEDSELLELERREIIGEILKINPAYKAPADYKPLLKEAKVPIPIKEYPGYNFIGSIFGAANDTQKRVEKETGAKIRVYGTKADTGGKVEITPTDWKENENTYDDMHVHVSADTFEKIDAAVALIELLVTPVSVNPVSSSTSAVVSDDNANTLPIKTVLDPTIPPNPVNQGTTHQFSGSLPPPQGQFHQFPQGWFSAGQTQIPISSSAPLLSQNAQVSAPPFNPTNIPSLFGPRPGIPASFSPVVQSHSVIPSRPQPSYMQTGGPRHAPLPIPSPPVQHNAPQNMPVSGPPPLNNPNNPIRGRSPAPVPFMGQSSPNLDSMRPLSSSIPRPQPSSSDFTFQPHRPLNTPPQGPPWQSSQPAHHNIRPPPQPPLMRPMGHNLNPSPIQGFPGPQMSHGVNQPRAQIPTNFSQIPPRHPMLPGPHMQPRNFVPLPHPINKSSGPFHPRPGNHQMHVQENHQMHVQENHLQRPIHPQRFPAPHQQFGNHPGRPFSSPSSVRQPVYDPFSPTSAPFNPQTGGGNAARVHSETDPEYEDLMASVGVK